MVPTSVSGIAALGISDAAIHAFIAALQGVVAVVVGAAVPFPSTVALAGWFYTSTFHMGWQGMSK